MAQTTSELWKTLWTRENVRKEYQFDIDGTIYGEDEEISHSVEHELYESFSFGNATIAKLTLSVYSDGIPKGATIKRFVRLIAGGEVSEWLPAGVFYTNRRSADDDRWTLEAFDAMRKADKVRTPDQSLEFPLSVVDEVNCIAELMSVEIDPRTQLDSAYTIDYPANEYTMRDVLRFIAAMHGGNWIITNEGKLLLVPLQSAPLEYDFLGDETFSTITFGEGEEEVIILV